MLTPQKSELHLSESLKIPTSFILLCFHTLRHCVLDPTGNWGCKVRRITGGVASRR